MKRIGRLALILCVVLGSGVCGTCAVDNNVSLVDKENGNSMFSDLWLMLKRVLGGWIGGCCVNEDGQKQIEIGRSRSLATESNNTCSVLEGLLSEPTAIANEAEVCEEKTNEVTEPTGAGSGNTAVKSELAENTYKGWSLSSIWDHYGEGEKRLNFHKYVNGEGVDLGLIVRAGDGAFLHAGGARHDKKARGWWGFSLRNKKKGWEK